MAKIDRNNKENLGFADRLKELRLQKKLSQSDLAKIIGVHHSHIGRYERGESRPLSKHLKALANALSVSTDYLLEGKTEDAAFANLEDREFLKIFEEAEKLPEEDKEVIKKLLNAFLMQKRLHKELIS